MKFPDVLKGIVDYLKKCKAEKFTGCLTFDMHFRQGGLNCVNVSRTEKNVFKNNEEKK